MKQFITLTILLIIYQYSFGQTHIMGSVVDMKGSPIYGVNIIVKDSYSGASTNSEGIFNFSFNGAKEELTLITSALGFKPWERSFITKDTIEVCIELKVEFNELNTVVILAGSFSASDKKRSAILKPLDVYTNPAAVGDLAAAIRSLPGSQAVSSDGQLLVRGGDATESSTYIDGALASEAYETTVPDIPSRSKFSSNLFSGIQFSTGGYSAAYGQALSSVLQLNTNGISPVNKKSLSLTSVGASGSITLAGNRQSISTNISYSNLAPYNRIVPSRLDFTKPFESIKGDIIYRYKPKKSGLIKIFVTADKDKVAYSATEENGVESSMESDIGSKSSSLYGNANYSDQLGEYSRIEIGLAVTYKDESLTMNSSSIDTKSKNIDTRITLQQTIGKLGRLELGGSATYNDYNQKVGIAEIGAAKMEIAEMGIAETKESWNMKFNDLLLASYTELSLSPSPRLSLRVGGRIEYSTLLKKYSLAPRVACALSLKAMGQISIAWGDYYQTPSSDILKFSSDLDFQKSEHFILNYQKGSADKRLFRAELYTKSYHDLVTYNTLNNLYYQNIENRGYGKAEGLDLFWKDKETVHNLEYWFTYSFVDTKRKYQNYSENRTPDFISKHSLSTVAKYWVAAINTQFGVSYIIASPRTYIDEQSDDKVSFSTNNFQELSANASYIFQIGEKQSILHISVSNLLNRDNILGYRYSYINNQTMIPQYNSSKQLFFIGLFLSF